MAIFYVSYSGFFRNSGERFPCPFANLDEAREYAWGKAQTRAVVLIYKDGLRQQNIIETIKCRRHFDKHGHLLSD